MIAPGNMAPILGGLYELGYDVAVPCVEGLFPVYNAIFFRRDEWRPIENPYPFYYSFCKEEPRRWYAYVLKLERLRDGLRLGVINTHFPLLRDQKMECARELNSLAMRVNDGTYPPLHATVFGGDTNIFSDDHGAEQEDIMCEGSVHYMTRKLKVDPDAERYIFGVNPEIVDEGEESEEGIGTFVGYEYDSVRPTSDRCRVSGDGPDRACKLDAVFATLGIGVDRFEYKTTPLTFPWRHEIEEGHLSSMAWAARNYAVEGSGVAPPPSDHIFLMADMEFEICG